MNKKISSHTALFFVSLIFGINYWVAKSLMPDYLLPEQFIFLRAAFPLLLFSLSDINTQAKSFNKKEHLLAALCGLSGISLNQYLFFKGLNLTTAVDASIIHTSSPMLVLLFAFLLLREKMNLFKIMGIILGAGGALLIIIYGNKTGGGNIYGNIYIFFNIAAYSLYLVLVKPLMKHHSPVRVLKWVFFYGFLFIIPVSIKPMAELSFASFQTETWISLAYVLLFTSYIAYILTTRALRHLNSSTAGFYIYFQPLFAALIGLIIYHQELPPIKILAGLIIFAGAWLLGKGKG